MLRKMFTPLALVIVSVLIFAGCDRIEHLEDAVENTLESVEDAVENEFPSLLHDKADRTSYSEKNGLHNKNNSGDPKKDVTKPTHETTTSHFITNEISLEQAKEIALKHANVTAEEAGPVNVEIENEHGIWLYEVSFSVGNIEYEYDIQIKNGKILSADKDNN